MEYSPKRRMCSVRYGEIVRRVLRVDLPDFFLELAHALRWPQREISETDKLIEAGFASTSSPR